MSSNKKKNTSYSFKDIWSYIYDHVKAVNDSKLFAGLIVIVLNVSSKFTTVPISKTMESYLKNSFSKHILVFAIAWMGTRDIFVATIVLIVFTLLMQVFLNEQSPLCCLTEDFRTQHLSLMEGFNPETGMIEENNDSPNNIKKEDIEKAIRLFESMTSQMKSHIASNNTTPNSFDNNNGYLNDKLITQTTV
jgi:hypothetical protein